MRSLTPFLLPFTYYLKKLRLLEAVIRHLYNRDIQASSCDIFYYTKYDIFRDAQAPFSNARKDHRILRWSFLEREAFTSCVSYWHIYSNLSLL